MILLIIQIVDWISMSMMLSRSVINYIQVIYWILITLMLSRRIININLIQDIVLSR